jgi:hypothetical protein
MGTQDETAHYVNDTRRVGDAARGIWIENMQLGTLTHPVVAPIAGIAILLVLKVLTYIVAIYTMITGILWPVR